MPKPDSGEAAGSTVRLRYFAVVAETAGVREETVELPPGSTVGDLRAVLEAARGREFAGQLAVSALLVDGANASDGTVLPSGEVHADVLPPFAGG